MIPPHAFCEYLSVHKAKAVGFHPSVVHQYKRNERSNSWTSWDREPMARDQRRTRLGAPGTASASPAGLTRRSGRRSRLQKSLEVEFEVADVLFPKTVELERLKPAVGGPHRE